MQGYCTKCRAHVDVARLCGLTQVTLKNGRPAAQGQCPKCGTRVVRIMGKDDKLPTKA
jgi:predicted RNA-binding Zn-ribbon protein involved in translation (DUF1610 family)